MITGQLVTSFTYIFNFILRTKKFYYFNLIVCLLKLFLRLFAKFRCCIRENKICIIYEQDALEVQFVWANFDGDPTRYHCCFSERSLYEYLNTCGDELRKVLYHV